MSAKADFCYSFINWNKTKLFSTSTEKLIEMLSYEAAFACLHDDNFDRRGKSRDVKVDCYLSFAEYL